MENEFDEEGKGSVKTDLKKALNVFLTVLIWVSGFFYTTNLGTITKFNNLILFSTIAFIGLLLVKLVLNIAFKSEKLPSVKINCAYNFMLFTFLTFAASLYFFDYGRHNVEDTHMHGGIISYFNLPIVVGDVIFMTCFVILWTLIILKIRDKFKTSSVKNNKKRIIDKIIRIVLIIRGCIFFATQIIALYYDRQAYNPLVRMVFNTLVIYYVVIFICKAKYLWDN